MLPQLPDATDTCLIAAEGTQIAKQGPTHCLCSQAECSSVGTAAAVANPQRTPLQRALTSKEVSVKTAGTVKPQQPAESYLYIYKFACVLPVRLLATSLVAFWPAHPHRDPQPCAKDICRRLLT